MANTPPKSIGQSADENFCYTSVKSNEPTFALREKKANGKEWVYDVYENEPSHPKPAVSGSQAPRMSEMSAAPCKATTLQVPGTSEEIFFPKAPHPDPVYEVEVRGVLEFQFFRRGWWSGERTKSHVTQKADAFYFTDANGISFLRPHVWLRVNGKPLAWQPKNEYSTSTDSRRKVEVLEAERGSHTYRFLVDHPGECLGIAFDAYFSGLPPGTETVPEGRLTVTVRPMPAGTATLAQRRQEAEEAEPKRRASLAPAAPPPAESPKESPEQWRDRQVQHARTQLEDDLAKDLVAIEAELRRQDLFDREMATIGKRTDLTDEQKERRIQAIRAVAAARLNPKQGGSDDASTAPTVL